MGGRARLAQAGAERLVKEMRLRPEDVTPDPSVNPPPYERIEKGFEGCDSGWYGELRVWPIIGIVSLLLNVLLFLLLLW